MIPPYPLPLVPLLWRVSKYTFKKRLIFAQTNFRTPQILNYFCKLTRVTLTVTDRQLQNVQGDCWFKSNLEKTLVAHWKCTIYFQTID